VCMNAYMTLPTNFASIIFIKVIKGYYSLFYYSMTP
jgi:hypothetical protein